MKKGIRILSLLLAVISLLGILGFPAAASMGYPMKYTIYYKAGDKKLGQTDGSCDAAADIRNNVRVPSPSYNGYVLKNDSDAVVTGSMISWKFPPSHYVRHGTGSYTVYYYEKACKMVVHYAYGSSLRQATADKVAYGKRGTEYYIVSPTISGYTPTRSAVSGKYSSDSNSSTVYYYENTYTVSYNANGGSGAPGSQTKAHFTPLTLSTQQPRRTGYTFLGWSSNPSAVSASYSPGDTYYRNGNTTLYAVWSSKNYTISYNANSGVGAPSPQAKSYGQTIYLSDKIPTRSGYTFLGWGLASSATVAAYQPGEAYYANASRTFYAVWEKNAPSAPDVYTVRYNANGGFGSPSAQTKKQNITLVLSSVKPQRNGYAFCGWATTPTAAAPEYAPGDSYTEDKNITLYAVWRYSPKTYTVSYDANGGSGAPASQTKKHGQNLILTGAIPTRPNHVFLGWATDSSSTSIAYTTGATYTANEDITLYAVWQERNYDFSASDLTVTPDEIEQYGKVTVKFRVDNWDRNLPYANIPVEVLLNGTVIYSTTVNFSAYGVQNIVFGLNVGASLGTQTLVARINWADHNNETRTGNNSVSATYNVKKVVETSTSVVSVNGEYTEGSQVISSFYVNNEGSSDVLPEDNVSFDFIVYTLENGTVKVVSQQTWSKVVIPANGRNLVYFKWVVPTDSAGTTYFCKGTITHENADKEQNSDNNTTEYAVVATDYMSSQTPNTRFEKNAPAGYSPNATAPVAKAGSATWNMWVYENGRLVLKSYGITVGNTTPTVTPGSGCLTAEKIGVTWKMKSGYGITLNWNPALVAKSGYIMPGTDAYTEVQSVYATFPEFGFSTASEKYRTLEKVGGIYQFVANLNADKNERVHFIPVYVANGNYTVSVTATQIWTPAGMITAVRNSNTLTINGTVYDDYYQGNK